MRRWRAAHPMTAAWRAVKDHAKARGIYFNLPKPYFIRFALRSDYLNRKGLNGHCLTIDRINNLRGYVVGNIQPLTRKQNTIKQARRDEIRMRAGMKWKERYK
jgi:hypothetical protein